MVWTRDPDKEGTEVSKFNEAVSSQYYTASEVGYFITGTGQWWNDNDRGKLCR